jgi:uncharacterized protein
MSPFVAYSIPIFGLKTGVHHYKFEIDGSFFANFEDSPVEEANIAVALQLDKRSDMLLLDFDLSGHVNAECDRCTAQVKLPLEEMRQLIVKYGEAEGEEEDEVVFIERDKTELNVAKYIYEFAVLGLPITNVYDCENDENPPCNFDVLQFLGKEDDEDKPNSAWDALKDLK